LCDENWRVMVDFVGRYENIEEDFGRVCKRIGIETPRLLHINNSKIPHGDYREYYDADTRAIVEKISEPTLRIFGYAY